jgi:hypothetical protein
VVNVCFVSRATSRGDKSYLITVGI